MDRKVSEQGSCGRTERCPLCHSEDIVAFSCDARRCYYRCDRCALVFVMSGAFVPPDEERQIYDQHQNDPDDADYRKFLARLAAPLLDILPPESFGLDFGCGPGPTLSLLLEEHGHEVRLYDQFYADDRSVWWEYYDFITATEVVEHLRDPYFELNRLWYHIKPGGVLALMTQVVPSQRDFANWYYKKDPTHICFYAVETFAWLAASWKAEIVYGEGGVVIMRRAEI